MFGTIKDILKFFIDPFISNREARKCVETVSSWVFGNKIYRLIGTKKYSTGLLAIGEQNKYAISPRWVTLDIAGADYNINFNSLDPFPFKRKTHRYIYTSHTVEHLSDQVLSHVLMEAFRLLENGGIIRIEAPDACKITTEYIAGNEKFFISLLSNHERKKYGKELKMHDIFIGLISCYIVNDTHIPVCASQEDIDNRLNTLTKREFFEWCFSLQSKEQLESGGHINAIYYEKLDAMLKNIGFKTVYVCENRKSHDPELNKLLNGIERRHRAACSLYIEAVK